MQMMVIKIINEIQNKSHNFASKLLMGISAPNIVYQLNELLPAFLAEPTMWALSKVYAIEWVEFLSTLAIVMLIVERYYHTKLNIAKRKAIENDKPQS